MKCNEWCIKFTSHPNGQRWRQSVSAAIPCVECSKKRSKVQTSELFDVSSEIVLVTGGGSGIGLAMAKALALNGAKLVLAGNDPDSLQAGVDAISALGGKVISVALDVRSDEAICEAFDRTEAELGPVSVVINNAGVAHRDKATHLKRETLREVMSVNVDGAFMVAQEAARRMIRDSRGGSIINISSVLSEMPMRQVSAYGASKAALSQMTRCLALEWAKYGIRVNEVQPGWFETGLTAPFLKGPGAKIMADQNPTGRLGGPSDLDGVVLLLASKASAYMTGSSIAIDGGHSIGR